MSELLCSRCIGGGALSGQISKYGIKFNNFTYILLQILAEGSFEAYWKGTSSDGESFQMFPFSWGLGPNYHIYILTFLWAYLRQNASRDNGWELIGSVLKGPMSPQPVSEDD